MPTPRKTAATKEAVLPGPDAPSDGPPPVSPSDPAVAHIGTAQMRPLLRERDTNPITRLNRAPLLDRIMYRTALAGSGCWLWRGADNGDGYGHIRSHTGGPMVYTHVTVYEAVHGPVPEGLVLDHLCRTPACCNPAHLEPVTHAVNLARGLVNQFKRRTHCSHAHEFTPENTYLRDGRIRVCRACRNRRSVESRRRRAAV